MFPLGSKVKDTITGFSGVVIARTEWLYGCVRYVVQPEGLRDGKPIEDASFDEQRLVSLEPAVADPGPAAKIGGPRNDPARQKDPTR